jgi:hypothetical protein
VVFLVYDYMSGYYEMSASSHGFFCLFVWIGGVVGSVSISCLSLFSLIMYAVVCFVWVTFYFLFMG